MKLKEQHSITRVDSQLMQSREGRVTHRLQTLYELELRRRYHKHKVMCHCYESFLFLAQKKTKEKNCGSRDNIQCARLDKPPGASYSRLSYDAPLWLPSHGKHQMFKGMCQYFENRK